MTRFEIKTSGVFNTEFTFEGSEKDCWNWMKEQWDDVSEFTVEKYGKFSVADKIWIGSMKNGRISKKLVFDLAKAVAEVA